MTDSFDKLREVVFAEIEKQRQRSERGVPAERAKVFGAFVNECLANLGRSRADFAKALDIEIELADAILDGVLPASEIGNEFLVEIARAIQYEPNLLRIMLGRATVPASSPREDKV